MAKQLQMRRGTTAKCDAFTGAEGELSVDTTKKTIRVHDGSTVGGTELARMSDIPTALSSFTNDVPYATKEQLDAKDSLPSQSGNANKFLTTDGTSASWDSLATVATSGSYNDLSDKPTIPATPTAYITETYANSGKTKWYRKWSDGWIEQGGYVASASCDADVTFPTAFTTTSYNVIPSIYISTSATKDVFANYANRRTTKFYITFSDPYAQSITGMSWYAFGY